MKKIAEIIEFILVQVIPFAELLVRKIKDWSNKK